MIYLKKKGVAVAAPVADDAIADKFYAEDLAIVTIDVASDFTGGDPPTSYALHGSSAALPTGLSLNTTTGEITGTPTTPAGAATIVVEGTNAGGSDTTTFDITIRAILLATPWVADLGSATDPTPITGSQVVRVGDLIVVHIGQQTQIDTTGVTDDLGNTYTAKSAGTDAGNNTGRTYYSIVTSAGTLTTINVANVASSRNILCQAAMFAGPFGAIDKNPADTTDHTSPFTCTATGVLSQAAELIVATTTGNGSDTITADSPNLLALFSAGLGAIIRSAIGYQTVAATTSVTAAFSSTTDYGSGNCINSVMSFTRTSV